LKGKQPDKHEMTIIGLHQLITCRGSALLPSHSCTLSSLSR